MEQQKTLPLTARLQLYNDKKTGQPASFPVFEVEVNGIKLQLKAADLTSRHLLTRYFGLDVM